MILNRQRSVRLSTRALESFLLRVRGELGLKQAQITVCLVSDAEIAGMNQSFRKKQGPTDVLSFPAVQLRRSRRSKRFTIPWAQVSENSDASLGDIAIAPARRQAKRQKLWPHISGGTKNPDTAWRSASSGL